MIRTRRASPIPRFLRTAESGDAIDLLGLSAADCTPSRIEEALERQLDRVSGHPEGNTPEGDEVRLALHAAAAQLLDPRVRREIISARETTTLSLQGRDEPARAAAAVHEPVAVPASTTPLPARAVRASLGVHEADPNANVRKLFIGIGVFGGLFITLFVLALIFLLPESPNRTTPAGSGTTGTGPATATTKATPSSTAATTPVSAPSVTTTVASKPAKSEFTDGVLVVRELRAASAKAKTDPRAGLESFRTAVNRLAEWWPKFEVGQRRAADDAVLEFLYVAGENSEIADAAVKELADRADLPTVESGPLAPERVWPAAWATGVLARLGEDRALPRSVAAKIAQALNDALGAGRSVGASSFESGAEAALRRMPVRLVAPTNPAGTTEGQSTSPQPERTAEGIKLWSEAVLAISHDASGAEQERMLVEGLEQVLISGPEPDQDRTAYEAVEVLITRIRWRANGAGRERLLDWFNDPRISAGDLRVLTGILASKSNAEGVDATMQLSVTATPDDRALLRSKYALAWGMAKTEAREKTLDEWRSFAKGGVVMPPDSPQDDVARVVNLAVAVRINHAARRLWLGDTTMCSQLLADATRLPVTIRDIATLPPGPTLQPGGGGGGGPPAPNPRGRPGRPFIAPPAPAPPIPAGEGPWAESYLKAERNIPVRLHRLVEAESLTSPLSRADASVLVDAAYFASPYQVRQAAQRVVLRFADDPLVVEACLDELPIGPRIQSVADMLSTVSRGKLPKLGDPDWELATRRALVDRLLGMLAGQGPQAGIDQASSLIGESYAAMAGIESALPGETPADRCVRAADQLFRLWRLEAERLPPPEHSPLTLEQIERRRRSREQIASGPLQLFAGEEASVAEMFAYIVCAERPVQSAKAQIIIDDMATDRRAATHIFDQMTASEKAITRLWMLRFGEGAQ